MTREELLRAGVSRGAIRQRLSFGALFQIHRGVYRVGHQAPSVEARYLAAVRAAGEGALLRGRAAAHLLGLLRGPSPPPEVVAPTERRIEGVITKRSRGELRGTLWLGIPVTTVPQTLVDLAAILSADELARACHEAGVRYGTNPKQVRPLICRNTPGARTLRAVLDGDVHVTLSKLEKRFLQRLQAAGLPLPDTNRPAGTKRVDCRWPGHRLTVELDGYRFHNSRHAWEQDRRREREAYQRGDAFRRYSYADVERAAILDEIASLTARTPGSR